MKAMNDATTEFLRCISGNFGKFGMVVEEIKSRSWASATFAGARHELSFRIAGEGAAAAADDFLAHLSATEFEMRGHIMADISLVSDERTDGDEEIRISLEALTVEDG
jgi:hypothetical protein